jgi:hypothetical protein
VASTPTQDANATSAARQDEVEEDQGSTGEENRGDSSSNPAAAPHSDSGGGSAQFRGGGDNSIQESGSEADHSEFVQAAAALHGYLEARAAERWKAACSYLSSEFRESLQQLTASSPEQGGGAGGPARAPCAVALAALSAGQPPAARHEAAVADAGALRINGDHGFLLFHGAHQSDYFMPMAREAGRWKIAGLSASALP